MPSHSCPTVSTPVASSIFLWSAIVFILEDHPRGGVVARARAGAEGPEAQGKEHRAHGDEPPGIRQMAQGVILRHRPVSLARSSWAAALLTSTMVPSTWR